MRFSIHRYEELRNDYLIIRINPEEVLLPAGPFSKIAAFFGWFTLLELTGPTSSLRREDWLYSHGCPPLFCAAQGIWDPKSVHVIRVASRLTEAFIKQVHAYHGHLVLLEPGIHEIRGFAHPMYCIETDLVDEPILRLFSPQVLKDPKGVYALLNEQERAIFIQVFNHIEQFKADPQAALKYADYEEFKMSIDEALESLMKVLPSEKVMRYFNSEERLKGLSTEERLKGLAPEERIKGLAPEERIKGLSPEEIEVIRSLLDRFPSKN